MEVPINTILEPEMSLIFYRHKNSSSQAAYIEAHPIKDGRMGAGAPLTHETMVSLLQSFNQVALDLMSFKEIIPERILYINPAPISRQMVWYEPQRWYTLSYRQDNIVKPYKVKLPAMICSLRGRTISWYCTDTVSKRPKMDSRLFHCPLPNTFEEGNICIGTFTTLDPNSPFDDLYNHYKGIVSTAVFTGENSRALKNGTTFSQMIKGPSLEIKVDMLIPTHKTIKNLLK